MKNLDTNLPTSLRRGAIRMDQDGPWSVSVAETPYDAHSFSLYIKSECLSFLFPYVSPLHLHRLSDRSHR